MEKFIMILLLASLSACKDQMGPSKNEVSQSKIDLDLKERLENILTRDQGVRQLFQNNLTSEQRKEILDKLCLPETALEKGQFGLMHQIDSANLVEVEQIIKEYGYPGFDLVGTPANEAVFYVIQHSDKIDQYLPLIRKAADNGDISCRELAKMEDRHLMRQGKEQIYGTQIKGLKSGEEWIRFVWPVKNPDSINELRKSMGLESIEEYAGKFGIEYKILSLEDVNKI